MRFKGSGLFQSGYHHPGHHHHITREHAGGPGHQFIGRKSVPDRAWPLLILLQFVLWIIKSARVNAIIAASVLATDISPPFTFRRQRIGRRSRPVIHCDMNFSLSIEIIASYSSYSVMIGPGGHHK